MTRLVRPVAPQLTDQVSEQARRAHAEAIEELQRSPLAGAVVKRGVELPDATSVYVRHNFRRYAIALVSPPRGGSTAGVVEEIRDSTADPRDVTILQANGWGATVTVDVVLV